MAAKFGFVVLLSLFVSSQATLPFTWSDCSSDKSHASLLVHSIAVQPVPLAIPGSLHISFNATVLKTINVVLMDFSFNRLTVFGTSVHLPCAAGIGSCSFDGCSILGELAHIGSQNIAQNISHQIGNMLSGAGANISCPIRPQHIVVHDFVLNIPALSSAMDIFANGDYNITVTLREPATDAQLGCVTFTASIVRGNTGACTGWLCSGRKRRRATP